MYNSNRRRLAEDDGHDHGEEEEEEGIDVNAFKIILLFCMIVCVSFGLIPKFSKAC